MKYLIHQMIEVGECTHPERPAIRFNEQELSYAELAIASRKLAALLHQRGVRRGDRVAIYQNKRLETAVALYGIMMAGAAYVPLDPAAPPSRTAFVLKDCGIRHVITQDNKVATLAAMVADGIELDCLIGPGKPVDDSVPTFSWDTVYARDDAPLSDEPLMTHDLAYIIYTSGSTGTPKGIMHTHASGLAYARWAASNYDLTGTDRIANHVPLHFDISTFDFFAGAVAGATTIIIPEMYLKVPPSYAQLLAREKISVLFTVPFALIQLHLRGNLDAVDLSALRWVIFGGEPFPMKHLHSLMAQVPWVRFNNMYGPAEVNGVTNYTVHANETTENLPIGPMAPNTEGRIVNERDELSPPGEPGELLVRSATMMAGYWGRPDLNAQAFFRIEVAPDYAHIYYRTGDLVCDQGDGTLVFLGRKDRQVKVRGYRVELDEVEAAVCRHDSIEEAGAYTLPDVEGSRRIVVEATYLAEEVPTITAITSFLKGELPAYAVPQEFHLVESLPRTSTGKIDRRALELRARETLTLAPEGNEPQRC